MILVRINKMKKIIGNFDIEIARNANKYGLQRDKSNPRFTLGKVSYGFRLKQGGK